MLSQLLNIVTTAGILYVVAAGLFVIFGVMNVINFAHGGFLLIGAYAGLIVSDQGWTPWAMYPVALLGGAVLGVIVELLVVHRLYRRPLDTILATWGLGIVITQLVMIEFGRSVQYVTAPMSGALMIGDVPYSKYRLFVLGVAIAIALGLALVTRLTHWGLIARAVIVNEELAKGMGVSIRKVQVVTFALGAAFASLAGALLAPMVSVDPSLGVPWLVSAFMIVLVAGASLRGFAISALFLGGSQALASFYISPIVGSLTIVLIAAVLLRALPQGLGSIQLRRTFFRSPSRLNNG